MATGKLRLGDRILEVGITHHTPYHTLIVMVTMQVNKFNVRFSTHQQAVQWLISQEGDIELQVQHVPQPSGLQVSAILIYGCCCLPRDVSLHV